MISPNTINSNEALTINVTVVDPDCVADLMRLKEGPERNQFANLAFQLGAQVLRQANAVIDHHTIAKEGNRLVGVMRQECQQHFEKTTNEVQMLLEKYFDPNDGSLPQRLERLVDNGGELESVLRQYVGDSESTLSKALDARLGADSPLLRRFSTNPDEGILGAFKGAIRETLSSHNDRFKSEFSLDVESSALSRLLRRLTDENGKLRKEFSEDVSTIREEFSRDNPDGALSRLLSQVGQAHRAIVAEFSPDNEQSVLSRITQLLETTNKGIQDSLTLDNEDSPLFRLKRELLNVVGELKDGNKNFQAEMREAVAALKATRKEAKRSTSHGNSFEDNASDFLRLEAQRLQDGFQATGNSFGAIRKKVGDEVITMGPESAAPGAKIVFECKGDKKYSLDMALAELQVAKQNRESDCGVFVFKQDAAPENVEPLIRWGNDIVVVWDDEDPTSDVYLKAAYSVARCIAVQQKAEADQKSGERDAIEKAAQAITRKAALLDNIYSAAKKICDKGDDILKDSDKLKKEIEKQLETIEEQIATL